MNSKRSQSQRPTGSGKQLVEKAGAKAAGQREARSEIEGSRAETDGLGGIRPWLQLIGWRATLDRWAKLNALGKLPQVLMIEGRAGLGKKGGASAAAAMSFCLQGTACGQCAPCRHILTGREPDIYWLGPVKGKILTAAAADLTEFLHLSAGPGGGSMIDPTVDPTVGSNPESGKTPSHVTNKGHGQSRGALRVAVIAQADRLTIAAANKLLKILEEPPSGCRIILTSSRPNAVLPTIRSRVVSWKVWPPPAKETLELIKECYEQHLVDNGLSTAAIGSDGSASPSSRLPSISVRAEFQGDRDKPPIKDLLEQGAYTPGGAIKALENWLTGCSGSAMIEKIMSGRSDLERLEACEPLTKARTVGPGELSDIWEVVLVSQRRQLVAANNRSNEGPATDRRPTSADLIRQHQARWQRRELRRLAGRHQIVLNGQLQTESLALTR